MEQCQQFTIQGSFSCTQEKNSIFLAYDALLKLVSDPRNLLNFFKHHKIVVNKRIKECGGLGGGPSNAATFLRMTNDICRLGLSKDELALVGSKVGADIPFFVHDLDSANIKGIGEKVEPFNEMLPDLKIFTPNINCNTTEVYEHFRQFCYKEADTVVVQDLEKMNSVEILNSFSGIDANDLCQSTVELYPEMNRYIRKGWFMSGSGSTVFRLDSDKDQC